MDATARIAYLERRYELLQECTVQSLQSKDNDRRALKEKMKARLEGLSAQLEHAQQQLDMERERVATLESMVPSTSAGF